MNALSKTMWTFLWLASGLICQGTGAVQASAKSAVAPRLAESYGKLPLSFEANRGQTDGRVKFLSRSSGYNLFLTANEAVLSLPSSPRRGDAEKSNSLKSSRLGVPAVQENPTVLRMKLLGANPQPKVSGLNRQVTRSNYFIGNDPQKWRTNVPNYARVKYQRVYPGIDLVFYGNQRQLEYDFIVAPGAEPARIRIGFDGARKISLNKQGQLVLHTPGGDVVQQAPVTYQMVGGHKKRIASRYVLQSFRTPHSALRTWRVAFRLAAYDRRKPLVIDPLLVLGYSTLLGGNNIDYGSDIFVDSGGNAYVTGTAGVATGTGTPKFPTTSGAYDTTLGGGVDAFVSKLNSSGSALLFSTFFGGSGGDGAYGIAVDASGNIFIAGSTSSTDLPTTSGAFDTTLGGSQGDVFVAKLNASGSSLLYSTYLGGDGYDSVASLAISSNGNAFITGNTNSAGASESTPFPTTSGAFDTSHNGGDFDAFVTKLNVSGSALAYSTFLGGGLFEGGDEIAVDSAGNAYVTGNTTSDGVSLPPFPTTAGARDTTYNGVTDGFVTKLNSSGSALLYSTLLGGSGEESVYGLALDGSGNAYVTGITRSANFPTTSGVLDRSLTGGSEAFVSKLNSSGSSLLLSTFLGGNGDEAGQAVALRGSSITIAGVTTSTDFPRLNAFDTTYNGGGDVFVTRLNSAGSALVYSTYLGGGAYEECTGLALDSGGNAYITGYTRSGGFPTTSGAFDTTANGLDDVFVAKFFVDGVPPEGVTITKPVHNSFTKAITSIEGTATDPQSGVDRVLVSILRLDDFQWWNPPASGEPGYWDDVDTPFLAVLTPDPTVLGKVTWAVSSGLPSGADLPSADYYIEATAFDKAAQSQFTSVVVTVDKTRPAITISSPANGSTFTSPFPAISGTVSDSQSGVNKVLLNILNLTTGQWWTGTAWGARTNLTTTRSGNNWSRTTGLPNTGLVNGLYTINATAYDNLGNTKSASVTISRNVTAAPSGAAKTSASTVSLASATARASDSSVQLTFNGALDAKSASDTARYSVGVNGLGVAVSAASVACPERSRRDATGNTVTLLLPAGALQEGDEVSVAWRDLPSSGGVAILAH